MMTLAMSGIAIVGQSAASMAEADLSPATSRAYRLGMPVPKHPLTVDCLGSMPDDGNRYEIIDGELAVTPPPLVHHQPAQMALLARLLPYARAIAVELFTAPVGVRASRDAQVEPDLLPLMKMTDIDGSTAWIGMPRLLLAVEVSSPGTHRIDREALRIDLVDVFNDVHV